MNAEQRDKHQPAFLTLEVVTRYRLVVITACSLAASLSLWSWLAASVYLGIGFSWYGVIACQMFSLLGFAHYGYTKNFNVLRISQLVFMLCAPLVVQLSMESGGVSAIIMWAFLTPVAVSMIAAREERHTLFWLVAYLFVLLSSFVLQPLLGQTSEAARALVIEHFLPANIAAFTVLLTLALYYSLGHRDEINQLRKHQYFSLQQRHTQLNAATAQKDLLLGSVLPARITQRLLASPEMIADGHSDVTVMFVDIVGFTKLADSMSPKQIVRLLNQLFSGFDEIAERHGLEKIKTIGDAFLAVGGLAGNDQSDYVEATVKAAQDLQRHIREQTQGMFNSNALDIHIGIATGPIAAGVIGKVRLSYDIWGNTVNLASRLADQATAGQILVDQTTYKRIYKKFEFSQEQELVLKGGIKALVYRVKGAMEMRRPPDSDNVVKLHA